jgi:hypothetical protein
MTIRCQWSAPGNSSGLTVVNAGEVLPASISDHWEAGVKTTLGRGDICAALFRINKVNGASVAGYRSSACRI